jgi:hypothetical protein
VYGVCVCARSLESRVSDLGSQSIVIRFTSSKYEIIINPFNCVWGGVRQRAERTTER